MPDSLKIEIRRPNKDPKTFEIASGVYTVGSDDECAIRLPAGGVDDRHAILTLRDQSCWVEDLASNTGTFVGDKRIKGRVMVSPGQGIKIGSYEITVPVERTRDPEPLPAEPPAPPPPAPPSEPVPVKEPEVVGPTFDPGMGMSQMRSVKQQIHRELVERLDIKRLSASRVNKDELSQRALKTIAEIVDDVADRLPPGVDPKTLVKQVHDEALGLGPIEDLLSDPEITEIMVNGHNQVYVEKKGMLIKTDQMFMDDSSVLAIIERIVSPIGRRIDESQPYVDARLPDGSRVNAIIHPLSLVGPCLTIRKFSKTPFTTKDLINFGTLTPFIADFTRMCVLLRKNIVVSGGTGCGKTSLLNVLSSYLPVVDRIVTIEDAAELRLEQEHVVRLEARPPNIEGKGAITIRDLVRNALRMRPDRIVVGECRGGEALDMLQAMNTGHDGSLTTVHANTPRDVISRLETMVLMSGMELPVRAIREQVASALDLIVHEARFSDGSRKIVKVTEVVGLEGEQITMQDIFEYKQTGVDEDGGVLGHFKPTGAVPTFIDEVASHGLSVDRSMFDPQQTTEV
jgi:pilus assembly protein CpaF